MCCSAQQTEETVTGVFKKGSAIQKSKRQGEKKSRNVSEPELLLSLECNGGVLTTRYWVNSAQWGCYGKG